MKRYKLLKDLPTFRAGQLAYVSSLGNLMAGTPEEPETTDTGLDLMMYHRVTLEKFPNILTEWFEEIEEPIDSIHWKPKIGDRYWTSGNTGVYSQIWKDDEFDRDRYESGKVYKTKEECEKARDRELAKVRLQRTSNFKPDFAKGKGGWVVCYDYLNKKIDCFDSIWNDSGEIVRYATAEDAKKSIKENEADWLKYFGIKED